ncbi:MAG: hypothetical protein ACOCQQ_02005 [Candidatus Nanoarchaeia archaeon]
MKYIFNYFFKRSEKEKSIVLDADSDDKAVMKFYDKIGIAEFGCVRANRRFFTDQKYVELKEKIEIGC